MTDHPRYGTWADNPTRCIEQVWPSGGTWIPHQCCRKRGHGPDGLYCKQHAKKHQPQIAAELEGYND
jgi:hypothetical protein